MIKVKQIIIVSIIFILTLSNSLVVQAFDFDNDPNFYKFVEGYKAYIKPVKNSEIKWVYETKLLDDKNDYMKIVRNGTSLIELRYLANAAGVNLEYLKHSDGTSYIIGTGKHDITGHTIVIMIEPKNNFAYVFDTDSNTSKVVNLGEYVQLYKGKTLVPVRKFIETFGGNVKYDKTRAFEIDWPSLHK